MMSINGDEDSAAALGLLYDYYKVPRERRSSAAKPDVEHPEPDHSKRNSISNVTEQPLISAGENRVQVLKNVPFNIVLPHGNQLGIDKRGHLTAPDTTVTVSIAAMPTHSIKTETQHHGFAVGIPPAVYHPEPTERVVVFDRNLNADQFSSGAQPPNAQRRTPDSTFSETFKEGVQEVFFPSDLSLRMPGMNSEDYVFDSVSGNNFEYTLEASKSLRQKPGDSTMTYLNKGQFYPVTLKEASSTEGILHPISKVRSVIMVVFAEDKSREDQLRHWRYWHSRQHTAKQRCIDIADYKESFNTISNIEEIAYNAISFTWDINDEAKVILEFFCNLIIENISLHNEYGLNICFIQTWVTWPVVQSQVKAKSPKVEPTPGVTAVRNRTHPPCCCPRTQSTALPRVPTLALSLFWVLLIKDCHLPK
ncbi:grainyhead-like protein 1 homolog isoform X2 [Physeter macrocephalus]|nr:grainyhead-like protein 1 homolog isoform X2 [Physeter catodon]XP_054945018.1 grainyhead-like protein 1 homolog isoform X2 [Physeter catodon]